MTIRQIEDRMVLRNFFTAGDGTVVDTSTRKIQALDDAGATTTEPTFVVSYADTNGSTLTLATNVGSLNGTTAVDLIGAPASGSQRAISEISIYNADSVQHTVTIRLLDSATPYIIGKFVVPPSYTLFYEPDLGWRVSNGATVGGGTVTSVGLTVPGVLFTSPVSGSPITGAGTFALALKTQAQNTFLTGPSSGADATPTFRAIAAADLPGSFAGFANPAVSVGLAAVNGAATTAMRSDAAPALDQSIVPTWTGAHTFNSRLFLANGSASLPELTFNTNYGLSYDAVTGAMLYSSEGVGQIYFGYSGVAGAGGILISTPGGKNAGFTTQGETSVINTIERYSANANSGTFAFRKARGTIASPAVPVTSDQLGQYNYAPWTGSAFTVSGQIVATLTETSAVDLTHTGTEIAIRMAPIGSGTLTEVCRFSNETGLSLFTNQVIDQNRIFRPRSYAVAAAPAVTATGLIEFSDEAGRAALGYADNVAWRRAGDNQVASATVDYKGVWSNLSARGSSTLLAAIQSTYQKLSDAGLLSILKGLWVHAMPNQTDALLNWITPGTRNLTITGALTFTANQGFTGDGSTGFLNSGATLAVFGAGQDTVAVGCYVLAASASAKAVIGQASNARSAYMQSATSGTITARLMTTSNDTFTPARYTGLFTLSRTASTGFVDYLDDVATSTITRTSSNGTNRIVTFLGTADTTASEFSTAQIAYSFIATGMAAADVANLSSIMGEFLETVGAISYSVTHLPPAANFKNRAIFVSDLGGGQGSLRSDGTNWRRENGFGYEARTLATGSETLTPLTNATFVEYTQTLSGNVTVTLGATDAKGTAVAKGTWLTITHNNGTPGAFTFAIANGGGGGGTLITFASATNKSATCVFDGTNWRLMSDAAI